MFKFLKKGIEFNNLAKSMNGMNIMIQDLIRKIEHSQDKYEFLEDILVLAYIARKGVMNRLEQFNWPMTTPIVVPTIERGRITLTYAIAQTVGKVSILAAELGVADQAQEIMEGGEAFYEFEKHLPDHIKKKI